MKFASIGHLIDKNSIKQIPKDWIGKSYIVSPEIDINNTKGHLIALKLTANQIMTSNREEIRRKILDCILFSQDNFGVDLIQLGALTTSVTSGGTWVVNQKGYTGYVNHGDSYTAAIAHQTIEMAIEHYDKNSHDMTLSIVGAYGIIGEALSKLLSHSFDKTILIGPSLEKLEKLRMQLKGNIKITSHLHTNSSDVIVTATNHPKALLESKNLKNNAIIVDVAQPPNLNERLCRIRKDINRIDGGLVDFNHNIFIPSLPKGKILSCIAEVIMQAIENERKNYIGSIQLDHLNKTKKWGEKYGFTLNELTNFGLPVS
jgi:predicted amino acid dehydrogenase